MIFEHPFCNNFCDNFPSHTHISFTLSLNCFGFRAIANNFFANYGCPISCQPSGCSNNTRLARIYSHDRFSREKNKNDTLLDKLVAIPTFKHEKHMHNILLTLINGT